MTIREKKGRGRKMTSAFFVFTAAKCEQQLKLLG